MFRKSCREGTCGSVNEYNGINIFACLNLIDMIKVCVKIYPLPHMNIVKDLVLDMVLFYAQLKFTKPWLQRKNTYLPRKESLQFSKESDQLGGGCTSVYYALIVQSAVLVIGGMEKIST